MSTDQLSDKEIFNVARRLDSAEAVSEYLDQICGDDPIRRQRILGLLDSDRQDSFLEEPPVPLPETAVSQHGVEREGDTIGPYKLLQKLGEGGMGVVYLAERQKPVKQRVAMKIIKQGMDTRQFVARFEAERQALAMMDHPNIAKVLDAGCTEDGRPYFVMELVKGVPINQFCDDNRLTTHERLELFTQVCQAVHHAHQKGIIHRDIKPSNVLVALYDGKPVPKVIDFGVAKAINQQLTDKTLFTEIGSILGTWEYMSPEQAVLNQLDVDTRSDVYSLGVLLYELLTGETPLDRRRLREAQIIETLRMIREDEPAKPSTRVSNLGEKAPTMAAYRRAKPESLISEIRGDLDWIVMKSLAKERSRRYDSANRFAEDVQRHLKHDVVEARPPSLLYRLNRIYHRNRTIATFAVACLLLLLTTAVVMSLAYLHAEQARQAARQALEREAVRQAANQQITRLEQTLAAALQTGASRLWATRVRGIADLFAGRFSEAEVKLLSCVKQGDDSLAIYALLSELNMNMGRTDDALKYGRMSFSTEPKTDDDRFFQSLAVYADPHASDSNAEMRFQQEKSPIALLIRSSATTWAALADRNMPLADEGVSDAGMAVRFLSNSDYAIGHWLEAICRAHQVAKRTGNQEKMTQLENLGRDVASEIQQRTLFPKLSTVGRFFEQIGDRPLAQDIYRKAINNPVDGWAIIHFAAFLMEENDFPQAVQVLESSNSDESWLKLMRARALGEIEGRESEAVEILKEIIESDTPLPYQVLALSRLSMLGQFPYVERSAKRLWNADLNADNKAFPPFTEILGVFAEQLNPETVIEGASGRVDKGDLYYCLAAYFYGRGEFPRSQMYLDQYRTMELRPGMMDLGPLLQRRLDKVLLNSVPIQE